MRNVVLVVVHYRNSSDTIECLESILRLQRPEETSCSVIVVDNASENGSWNELLAWQSKVPSLWSRKYGALELPEGTAEASTQLLQGSNWQISMLRSSQNQGYAAGANVGLRFAMHHGSATDFWVLNNDVVLHREALIHLLDASKERPRAIYGSTLLCADDETRVQVAGGAVYLPALGRSRHLGKQRSIAEVSRQEFRFDYIVGASLFFSREVIREIGLMPSQYVIYFEETEFCARAKARGIDLIWVPKSRMVHKEGRATGTGSSFRKLSDLSFRYIVRNSMLFTEHRYPVWLLSVLLFNLLETVRHCCLGDWGKVRIFFEALAEYRQQRTSLVREMPALGD